MVDAKLKAQDKQLNITGSTAPFSQSNTRLTNFPFRTVELHNLKEPGETGTVEETNVKPRLHK